MKKTHSNILRRIVWIFVAILVAIALWYVLCISFTNLSPVISPDGKGYSVITIWGRHDLPLPGPEPPRIRNKSAQLVVSYQGQTVYKSGYEIIGPYQNEYNAFDIVWSPDSSKVACRFVNEFRTIHRDGAIQTYEVAQPGSLISSFQWINPDQLIVICKGTDTNEEPLDLDGSVLYGGYLARAINIQIIQIDIPTGLIERYHQDVHWPTFLFHAISFCNHEISPTGRRIAFSDGANLCVYDRSQNSIIVKTLIDGCIEGIWWDTDDQVVVGIGLLSAKERRFAIFQIHQNILTDSTSAFLPLWDGIYRSSDWFKNIKAEKQHK